MMNSMATGTPVGVHLLVNVYDVPDTVDLEYLVHGLPVLDDLVRRTNLHVMSQTGHQFYPVGYSYAYVLSESHFTIHTYPEHRSCYIDIFCCSPDFDAKRAVKSITELFRTQNVNHRIIQR